jgi:hypothetical protein
MTTVAFKRGQRPQLTEAHKALVNAAAQAEAANEVHHESDDEADFEPGGVPTRASAGIKSLATVVTPDGQFLSCNRTA